jgi:hypothetical protein
MPGGKVYAGDVMNPLTIVFGAALAASYFLPWVEGGFSPQSLNPQPTLQYLQESPPFLLAFLGTFVLAALVALLSLFGARVRLLTLLAALLPFGLAGYALWTAPQLLERYGMPPITSTNLSVIFDQMKAVAGMGVYAWFGGALGLFLAFLFAPERR